MKVYGILFLVLSLIGSIGGLIHYVKESGKLELENDILAAQAEAKDNHIAELGLAYANLNIKYYELESGHEEIQKFENADLSKIPIDKFIIDWNSGSTRVLQDFEYKTEQFYRTANKAPDPEAR